MEALIISLNFNPGHFSHLVANYKLLEDCGYKSYLYVTPLFNQLDEKNEFRKINHSQQLKQLKSIKTAIFWFPSLKNILEMARFKYLFKSQVIYIYHEPFDSIKNYYNSGFRIKKIIKICLIGITSIPMLLLSDHIILPSNASYKLYAKKYKFLNSSYSLIPLLFDDEAAPFNVDNPKVYISYIGTVAADHAFDKFINFVNVAVLKNWFDGIQFLIATSSQIPEKQQVILNKHMNSGRITISAGSFMTNGEINYFYQNSMIVWNAYNRSMQSGVLPKAYMFGAAVIVLTKNINEFTISNVTTILIDNNGDTQQIKEAMQRIVNQKATFITNCREMFLKTFFYKSKIKDFYSIVKK